MTDLEEWFWEKWKLAMKNKHKRSMGGRRTLMGVMDEVRKNMGYLKDEDFERMAETFSALSPSEQERVVCQAAVDAFSPILLEPPPMPDFIAEVRKAEKEILLAMMNELDLSRGEIAPRAGRKTERFNPVVTTTTVQNSFRRFFRRLWQEAEKRGGPFGARSDASVQSLFMAMYRGELDTSWLDDWLRGSRGEEVFSFCFRCESSYRVDGMAKLPHPERPGENASICAVCAITYTTAKYESILKEAGASRTHLQHELAEETKKREALTRSIEHIGGQLVTTTNEKIQLKKEVRALRQPYEGYKPPTRVAYDDPTGDDVAGDA